MTYYTAKRPLIMGSEVRNIGELVPEAEEWNRTESWVRTGYLVEHEGSPPAKKKVVKPQVQRT